MNVRSRLVALLILLVACTHKTPEQKLLDDVDSAVSWVGTLQFAGEKWLSNSVPSSFVRATVDGAKKDFDKTTKTIAKSPARKELRDSIGNQIELAQAAAEHVKEAIEKNDRRTVAKAVRQFAIASAALQQLEQNK